MGDVLTLPTFATTRESRPRPFFDTVVQGSPSGVEARAGRRTVARYRVTLTVQLRSWVKVDPTGPTEDSAFFNFFLAVGGMRDSFLHTGTDGIQRRWRFDTDSLDDLDYEGGVYSGDVDLVSVVVS